jgi:hypothetical protein
VFGVYLQSSDVTYIQKAYRDVYKPEKVSANPDTWRRVFLKGAETPLRVTQHGLDTQRYWYHDLLLFVFDPSRATDLIDVWNLGLEPHPVLPIPIGWFEALADDIYDVLKSQHRPVVGNPPKRAAQEKKSSKPEERFVFRDCCRSTPSIFQVVKRGAKVVK